MDEGKESTRHKPRQAWPVELKLAVAKAFVGKQGNGAELAKLYDVPVTNIYEWATVFRQKGEAGLAGKRPGRRAVRRDPARERLAAEIVQTKKQFGWFGVTRLTQWLKRTRLLPVTEHQVETTLKQANLVTPRPKKRRRAEVVRFFERAEPNQLWQVDITMWTVARGQKVYLIAFLDDYSRYIVAWGLYASQGSAQVLEVLRNGIGQYGAPKEILSDQGRQFFAWRGKCPFQKELAREGIHQIVSRSHHPQTLGKVEAFWKHLKDEFLRRVVAGSINDLRERLRLWIDSHYNFQRPHQGIGGLAPADRYFKMADSVRALIQKGVQQNAERLAVGKEPIAPFYLAGRMGRTPVVIRQQGGEVVLDVGDQELEKINLKEDNDAEAEPGSADRGGATGGQGAGAGGADGPDRRTDDRGDLPADGAEADPVLSAGGATASGNGDGGGGESSGRVAPKRAGGGGGPGGAQPEAAAGEPADAGDAEADAEALQNGPPGPKSAGSQEAAGDGAAAGGDAPERAG